MNTTVIDGRVTDWGVGVRSGVVSERAVLRAAQPVSRAVGVFADEVAAGTASAQYYEDIAHDCSELAGLFTDVVGERWRDSSSASPTFTRGNDWLGRWDEMGGARDDRRVPEGHG